MMPQFRHIKKGFRQFELKFIQDVLFEGDFELPSQFDPSHLTSCVSKILHFMTYWGGGGGFSLTFIFIHFFISCEVFS